MPQHFPQAAICLCSNFGRTCVGLVWLPVWLPVGPTIDSFVFSFPVLTLLFFRQFQCEGDSLRYFRGMLKRREDQLEKECPGLVLSPAGEGPTAWTGTMLRYAQ